MERGARLDDGQDALKPERWQRLQELFLHAISLPDEARATFADDLDEADRDLLDDLRRMLQVHQAAVEGTGPFGKLPAEDRLIGVQLGDYRIDTPLGQGGSGTVYRATQVSRDRAVAVKVLRPGISISRAGYERFKREALAASRLRHPNLVPVYYFGRDEGHDYLVMELVEGLNLRDQLLRCRGLEAGAEPASPPDLRDPRACATIVRDLARALDHAHQQRLLHRDVKPLNILLDAQGIPRLTDFGLAKDLELEDLTLSGEVAGTPHYMSPEQARAARHRIDHRSDIYSLGAVLYEMLSGRTPVAGETTAEVIHNILHQPVVPLQRQNSAVPAALALICMQALRRNPARRYQSAGALADDLDSFLANRSVMARAQGIAERAVERLVDRRVLLRLIPIAAVLGISAGGLIYYGADRVHANSLRPRVEVYVIGDRDAEVSYLPLDGRHLPAGPAIELGRARDGRLSAQAVPLGDARIIVRTDDGAFSEHYRSFAEGETVTVTAHPRSLAQTDAGMARFEATSVESRELLSEPPAHGAAESREPLRIPAFGIDEACVTNREYSAFLEATGKPAPDRWSPGWLRLWAFPPREDWLELPVVGIDFPDALEYAEWAGKRLPTALELELARGAYDDAGAWVERALGGDAVGPFNLGLPELGKLDPSQDLSTGAAYVLYARPAREATLVPGARIHHAVGNVGEWTETRAGAQRRTKFDAWFTEVSPRGAHLLLFCEGTMFDERGSQNQGFRCARSLGW